MRAVYVHEQPQKEKKIKSQKNKIPDYVLYATYRWFGINFPDFGVTVAQTPQNSYTKEMEGE